jgi:hypothetical protein
MRFIRRALLGFVIFNAAVAAGAFVAMKRVPRFGSEEDDRFSLATAMGGIDFDSTAPALTDGAVFVLMGGAEIDLMDAELAPDAHLTLKAIMGGINVVVPPSWRVEVRSNVTMGDVVNLTDPDDPADGPVLVIDAVAVMGGIVINDGEVD